MINRERFHGLCLEKLALHIRQPLPGFDMLKDNPIRPGGLFTRIGVDVENPEQATIEQTGFINRPGWINDYFPLITLGWPVDRFGWIIKKDIIEKQVTSDIFQVPALQVPKYPRWLNASVPHIMFVRDTLFDPDAA